jgi:hypothetical protein
MDEDEDVVEGEVGGAEVEGIPVRRVQERLERECTAVVAGLRPLPQLEALSLEGAGTWWDLAQIGSGAVCGASERGEGGGAI